MDDDRELILTPVMELVPAVVDTPEQAIDTMGDRQGVLVGHQYAEGYGPIVFIGVRDKSGKAMVAGVPEQHWKALARAFNEAVGDASQAKPLVAS